MPRGLARITNYANKIAAWEAWNKLAAQHPKLAARFQPKEDASWRKIDKASRRLREAIRDQQFSDGVAAGEADMRIVSQPVGTNGHTEGEYLRIKDTYEAAAFALEPTDYQRGYAIGADIWAHNHQKAKTDWAMSAKEDGNVQDLR
jgi:hypothetical protein